MVREMKRQTAAAVIDLNERINRAVEIQRRIEDASTELKAEKTAIRSIMEASGLNRQATVEGSEALLVAEEKPSWNVEKLAEVLSDEQMEDACPMKADGKVLRQLLDAEKDAGRAKELRRCAKWSKTKRLELRSAV